jgi:tetratricopeptide (TPR) repeat protein
MGKRWTEAELQFLTDNAGRMSDQALAEALSVRVDEVEARLERLGLRGGSDAPSAKPAQTLKELSRHTENARKDFDRGVAALQKRKFDESDLIQKYPDERELVDRARMYLAVCARRKDSDRPAPSEPEDFYYAAVLEKNRGNVDEAIEHLKRATRRNGDGDGRVDFLLACCYAQRGEARAAAEHLRRAIDEDGRHRVLARHDRDFDPVREAPEFLELLAS